MTGTSPLAPTDVAIIGIAGRYSQAESPQELWAAVVAGRELNYDGAAGAEPGHVSRYSAVSGIEDFDHEFFGFTPAEAALTDPQHRLLLECAFRALEDAGYADLHPRRFGVFASSSLSTYLINNIVANGRYRFGAPNFGALIGNDKDMLAPRLAYKLNLTGPALTIQTACSSSLVALNSACVSLLARECDGAVVGAASVTVPWDAGYRYEEGGILSRDGFCRPFDASSSGIVKGNGCSVVVLKRAADAQRDGDRIYALVRGTAVNNDGSAKAGFTAPSVTGQADVIANCLAFAGLSPDDIDCVEAHGTGTQLGDPIELAALSRVFHQPGRRLPIGSIKANIGHLDAAAGLTGVIKGLFMLATGLVPGNMNLVELNPGIDNSAQCLSFPRQTEHRPLRTIGVSSFGIGGTNAHAILACAPEPSPGPETGLPLYLLPLSYARPTDEATHRQALRDSITPDARLRDVAFTLSTGRRWWPQSRYVAVATMTELRTILSGQSDGATLPDVSLAALLRGFGAEESAVLAGCVPDYRRCLAAVREGGAGGPAEERAALLLLLRHLEAIDGPEAAEFPGPMAAADAAYGRSELLTDSSRRLADDGCGAPAPQAAERGHRVLREVYGFLAGVGAQRALNLRPLFTGLAPQRLSLPGAPMVKSRHWIDAPEPGRQSPAPAPGPAAAETVVSPAAQALQLIAQGVGSDLALDDDFYQAGGDSLLAISIIGDLNDRFGTSVTLEDFMACPTIGDIVKLVCDPPPKGERARPSFMKVIRDDAGPTVFALHPAGGTTFCYRALNRVLSVPFTLIGLDLPDRYAEMASMASLARFYADAVAKEQPSGRIALCGYSFGGNLAVEMGKALVADGREVAPLLMIDALPPETYAGPDSGDHRRMLSGIIAAYQRAKGHEGTGTGPSPEGDDASAAAALGLSEPEASRFADAWFYHYELLRRPPEAGVFQGGARVLRADTALEPALAQTLHLNAVPMQMWRQRFTGPIEIVPIPGDHLSCMADPVGLKAIGMELERWVAGLSEQHHEGTGSS